MGADVIRFDAIGGEPAVAVPRLGEHTDAVLATLLGLDSGAIGRLHDSGVVA